MEIVIRASVIYFFLWLLIRGIGKRELAELTAFELVLLITMGDLVQQGVTQEDMSLTGAMMAVGTIAFWIVVFSYVSWRFKKARPVLEGLPVILVRNGRPLEDVLRLERITLDELKESARGHGINDLRDIKLGILEPDGRFSFITNSQEPTQEQESKKV